MALLVLLVGPSSASYHRPRRRSDFQQQQFGNYRHPYQQQQNVFQHNSISSPAQRQFHYRRSRQMLTPLRTADQLPAASSFGSRRLHTIENPHAITVSHQRDPNEEEQLRRIRLTLFLTQLQNHDSGAHQLILTDASTHVVQQPQSSENSININNNNNADKPKRKKKSKSKSKLREKQSGCPGRCTNMLSCMLQGGRTLRRSPSQGCFGLMEVCCVTHNNLQSQQVSRRRPRNRRRRRRRKNGGDRGSHGRALPHPLDSVSYSSKKRRPSDIAGSLENLVDGSLEILQQGLSGSRHYPRKNQLNNLHLQHLDEIEEEGCGLSRAKNVAGRRIMGGLDAGYGQVSWKNHSSTQ